MPTAIILPADVSAALSTSVTLAAGAYARIGLFAGLPAPVNAAFSTATTGGTLAAATYSYRVSALNAQGESLASAETSQATTGTTSTVTINWGPVSGATGYKIYGRTAGAEQLIATVGAVTTYTDTGASVPVGALPSLNSTASGIPAGVVAALYQVTPAADNYVGTFSQADAMKLLIGPGTWRVSRGAGPSVGVYSET